MTRHRRSDSRCARAATTLAVALGMAACSPKVDTPWGSTTASGSAVASGPVAAPVASAPASAGGTVSAAPAPVAPASQAAPASSPLVTTPAPPPAASAASGALPSASATGSVGGSGTASLALVTDAPLLVPVEGVQPHQLVDTYTQSRSEGRTHEAIDILAPRGTPVRAVADGRVAKLFTSRLGGLTVYQFDRQERVAYYYAHLDAYAPGLTEGRVLRRGEVLGTVGVTGNSDPNTPHLHFAVFALGPERRWWEGSPLNPYPLMQPGGASTSAAASVSPARTP